MRRLLSAAVIVELWQGRSLQGLSEEHSQQLLSQMHQKPVD
tara:strand:- start:1103 stop:1225 length:123 start_codon:yes stop_codon:yes gene_type:complete